MGEVAIMRMEVLERGRHVAVMSISMHVACTAVSEWGAIRWQIRYANGLD